MEGRRRRRRKISIREEEMGKGGIRDGENE